MSERENRLLVVFSRNPVAGRVKTRLAASIGDREALAVYEHLRDITERETSKAECDRAVYYSDFIPENDLFLKSDTRALLQSGADLGERMHRAFIDAFTLGYRHVVLIGTDCPDLSAFLIDRAFESLAEFDVVLGPARDGGFYLIGLKHAVPELFLGRRWSTSAVLTESLNIIRSLKKEYTLLPALSDIDTIDDLLEWGLWKQN
ncbi:MAG: TIGR04282 family arsenosugar biosynthesis glycosyltransferase [Chlorobiales bacterium]|nr:TIGR04282 family arsenosugar biosynthesis glycosyltransferase [Chlorobiales bacterium]